MNDPELDHDLRQAFQRWRAQESEFAPAFSRVRSPRPQNIVWLKPAFAALAAVVLGIAIVRSFPSDPPLLPPRTLAQALPEPLLRPPSPTGFDLTIVSSGLPGWGPIPSDFLLPQTRSIP